MIAARSIIRFFFSCLVAFTVLLTPLHGAEDGARIEILDLRQIPLGEAARIFSDQTGINIVPSAEAAKMTVSLYLTNVRARDALEALCKSNDLWYREERDSNIVRVHTPAEYQRNLNSFREETTEVFTLRYPNAYDAAKAIGDLFGDRVRLNLDERDDHTLDELQDRFDRFDTVDGRSQGLGFFDGANGGSQTNTTNTNNTSINSSRGTRNQMSNGGRLSSTSGNRSRSQNQPPARLQGLTADEVQALENASPANRDQAVQQLVEKRTDIFVNVINRLNKVIVRTSDQRTMDQIRDLITRIDIPTKTVLLEVKILSVQLTQGYHSAVDYLFDNGNTKIGFTTNGIQDGELTFEYASKNFHARLQVLEQKGHVREIATPTLLTANNEVSRLFVGEERPLNRGFSGPQTVVGNSTVVSPGSTAIEFRPVGTTLLITPNINADGTVTLRLLQEVSNILTNGASVLVPTSTGFSSQNVDTVRARSVSGTVVGRDGVPVVIGGLIDTSLNDSRSQVPFLGDIPVLGTLFGKRDHTKSRSELVLLICPHLVDPREGGARESREVMEKAEAQVVEQIQAEKAINAKLRKKFPAPTPKPNKKGAPTSRSQNIREQAK